MNALGSYLRKVRKESGRSLADLAKDLSMDITLLSRIETGKRDLAFERLAEFSTVYNIPENELQSLWMQAKNNVEEPVVLYQAMVSSVSEIRRILSDIFKTDPRIERAFLFGSISRKQAHVNSDIDIMLEIKENEVITIFDLAEIKNKCEQKLNRKADINTRHSVGNDLATSIQPDLKLIYERKS
ncbi:MAG: helix-turn-helix domain-containing protein [Bacteroidales bacterium]|nr:helix-turn-helix domain-containing protein [Bacteroidales bacterium]